MPSFLQFVALTLVNEELKTLGDALLSSVTESIRGATLNFSIGPITHQDGCSPVQCMSDSAVVWLRFLLLFVLLPLCT